MSRLSTLSLRNLWSRKLRTLVTGLGIVLGVATVLAFGITNATVENSLTDLFSQTAGDADLTIASDEQGQTFRERALRQAAEYPGVTLAAGSLWREGDLRLPDEDKHITLLGVDPQVDPLVRSYRLAAGRMIDPADRTYTILLASAFAEDNDILVGDDLEIDLGDGHVETFEVAGLLENEGVARLSNGAIGLLRLDAAQDLFDERGRLSQIDLVAPEEIATDGQALDQLKASLAAALGDDYTVSYPSAVGQAIVDSMASLRSGLGVFSTIALFVGAMLIYNTFTMTITERTAEIGLLRAVGATRSQILRLVLVEALLLGCLGSVLGLGLGVFLAIPLVQIFSQGFGGIPLERFTVPPGSIFSAVLVGVAVTLTAALLPAWQAGRISPVEAMRVRAASRRGFLARNGWKIGLVLLAFSLYGIILEVLSAPIRWLFPSLAAGPAFDDALSAILLVAGLVTMAPRFWTTVLNRRRKTKDGGRRTVDEFRLSSSVLRPSSPHSFFAETGWVIGLMLVTAGLAHLTRIWDYLFDALFFMLMFTGGTLVVPVTIQLLERVARSVLSGVYGPPGGLGSRNLNRARGRTSLTVGVLMVGATLTIAIGSLQAAFDGTMQDWVHNTLGGDLTITSQREQEREFSNQLMGIPGVQAATPFSLTAVQLTGARNAEGSLPADTQVAFQAIELPTYRQVAGFQFVEDEPLEDEMLARLAEGNAVLISSVLADKYDVHRGDAVRLRTRRGEHEFEVAGVTMNFMWGGNSVIGMWSDGERYLGVNGAGLFLVQLAPGADAAAVEDAVQSRLSHYGDLEIASAVEFREDISQDISQFMAIFNVVVYIAVLVAGLGVVNTMTMNILERVREIGMLRAIGMTRSQVGRMVLAEAGAMGAIGGLFGLGIGWLISQDMVTGMSQGSGWQFDYVFPTAAFISAASTALIVSQLAALYPVWRAGGMRIVEAIQHE